MKIPIYYKGDIYKTKKRIRDDIKLLKPLANNVFYSHRDKAREMINDLRNLLKYNQ